ncbi:non-canonical purine NTP pyrophosphatase [Gemmatimonas sp.]|uniref:non-canonical purine NTP pyrophosphatase n=1 Tax=Gemmatimonas sp. TaxID=1962908 RepID=UPI00333F2693
MGASLVLATRSAGKLRELGPLLAQYGWHAMTLDELAIAESGEEEALEQFDTFEANALAKARYFAQRTGRVVLADDSGLVVDALDGQPGVRSKRWSGSPLEGSALDTVNNAYLQAALDEAARRGRVERTARYVCAAACVWATGACVRLGTTEGTLLSAPRGDGGFGYDPYFLSADLGVTFAEAGRDAKAAVSHRGRAVEALCAALAGEFEPAEKLSANLRVAVDHGPRSG